MKEDVEGVNPWDFFRSMIVVTCVSPAGRWICRHMEKRIGAILCGVKKPSPVQYVHDLLERFPKPPLCLHSSF